MSITLPSRPIDRKPYVSGELRVAGEALDFRTNDFRIGRSGGVLRTYVVYEQPHLAIRGQVGTLEEALDIGMQIAREHASKGIGFYEDLAREPEVTAEDYYEAVEQARS